MEGFLGANYLWIKAVHLIFVIFWMAGLFMLPRFFVYHIEAGPGSDEARAWEVREKRILRIIMNPSMVLSLAIGLALAAHLGVGSLGGWFHTKMLLVAMMFGFHMYLANMRKKMAAGRFEKSGRFFRLIGEIPGLLLIPIVILVIVQPF